MIYRRLLASLPANSVTRAPSSGSKYREHSTSEGVPSLRNYVGYRVPSILVDEPHALGLQKGRISNGVSQRRWQVSRRVHGTGIAEN